ncbi:MAG: hypothetical protein Q4A34_01300 [Candidatus Saccharibacteria bacterium]|nr:hypothetical protein [Candidatus Saccharibacteria bacterium]
MYPNDPNTTPQPQGVPPQPTPPQQPPYQAAPSMPPQPGAMAQPAYQAPPAPQPPMQPMMQPPAPQPPAPQPPTQPMTPQPPYGPSPVMAPGVQPMQQSYPPLQNQPQTMPITPSPYDQSVFQKRRFRVKLVGGAITAMVLIGISIASFIMTQHQPVTLEKYEGDGYAILVPKEYKKETNSQGTMWTSREYEGENGEKNVASRMAVLAERSSAADVQELIRQYDSGQQEFLKSMADGVASANDGANITLRDVETKKDNHRGLPARSVTAKAYSGDKMTGMLYVRTIFTEKGMYMVVVAPHQQVESGFRESAQKILDSFEVK